MVGHRTLLGLSAGPSSPPTGGALAEELVTDPACVLGCLHSVAPGPRVCEDLMVISTLRRHEADAAVAGAALEPGCQRNEEPAILRAGRNLVSSFLWKLRDRHH